MRLTLSMVFVAAIAVAAMAHAQAFPNLSGRWVPEDPVNAGALFANGLSDVPGDGALTITQDEKTINISRTGKDVDLMAKLSTTFIAKTVYKLDGSESTNSETIVFEPEPLPPGIGLTPAMIHAKPLEKKKEVGSRAEWNGEQLVITTKLDGSTVTSTYELTGEKLRRQTTSDRFRPRPPTVVTQTFKRSSL